MSKKQKYYTVWKGRQTGVFQTWKEAEEQVKGFEKSRFKSFQSLEEAENAYKNGKDVNDVNEAGKKKKEKFCVIWKGERTGIFPSYSEAKKYLTGGRSDQFMAFSTMEEAEAAFAIDFWDAVKKRKELKGVRELDLDLIAKVGKPILKSISVDAACAGNPGILEYQGVETKTKSRLFSMGPFPQGTVNIGEFLAIVHGLAFLKKHNSDLPLYSDSKIAIGWIKNKKINTGLERNLNNEELFQLVDRAEKWLDENHYSNEILKWETKAWGENPADYGRK